MPALEESPASAALKAKLKSMTAENHLRILEAGQAAASSPVAPSPPSPVAMSAPLNAPPMQPPGPPPGPPRMQAPDSGARPLGDGSPGASLTSGMPQPPRVPGSPPNYARPPRQTPILR